MMGYGAVRGESPIKLCLEWSESICIAYIFFSYIGQGENGRTGTKPCPFSDGSVPHRILSGGCRIIQI